MAGSDPRRSLVEALVVMPPELRELILGPSWARLERVARIRTLDRPADGRALVDAAGDAEVLVTSWGQVPLDAAVLDAAPRLRLVAHAAASVKHMVTPETFRRGVRVTQAGVAMARPVAEVALALTLAMLHRVHRFDHALHAGETWENAQRAPLRHEMSGSVIGVVGASRTGRAYIAMARALGAVVLVHDPFVDSAEAERLGVRAVDLEELLRTSRVVVLHAPSLPETRRMIGARQLALMPDGGALVNTARSWLVDEAALLAELRTGRLDAGIDVFDDEPLPVDSPFRALPNVMLTPHQAAGTIESRQAMGALVVDEIERYAAGEPLLHEVTEPVLARMA